MERMVKCVAYIRFTQFGGQSMPTVRKVSFQDILKDVRSGMSHMRLLEKYDLTPKQLLGVFEKLIRQERFTMEEYKSWEDGQKPPTDKTDREKPFTPDPTPSKVPEVNHVELEESREAVLTKCPSCGVMTRAEFGYCRACNYKLPEGKPLPPKPAPAESPEAGLKKCSLCGVPISTASEYCVACSDKLREGESTKVVARKNGYAIAGLCLGIASIFLAWIGIIPILAVVVSSIGLYKVYKVGAYEGKGAIEAWIGLALGIIFTFSYLHLYGYI